MIFKIVRFQINSCTLYNTGEYDLAGKLRRLHQMTTTCYL